MTGRRGLLRALLGGLVVATPLGFPVRAWADTYTYDALGRVISITYANGNVVHFGYDSAGNRFVIQANGSAPTPPTPAPPPPADALAAAVSATTWNKSAATGEDEPVAVLVNGGYPPYAFLWERVTGLTTVQPDGPAESWTAWVWTGGSPTPPLKQATWRCRVTDAASTVVYSPNVAVTIDVS